MGRAVTGEQMKTADLPLIRLFGSDGNTPTAEGVDDTVGWLVCTPESIRTAGNGSREKRRPFTEVGFVFGRRLHRELGVPIGLFQMNCGGSTAKDWTPTEGAADELTLGEPVKPLTHKAGRLYEVRMRGTVPMTVRGVVWYQGEDDGRNSRYAEDFAAMIAAWRRLYRDPNLPFAFAQIAQTTYASGMLRVWEAQQHVMHTVPHTGMAVSNDIYVGTKNGGFKQRIDAKSGLPIAGGGNPHPTGKDKIAERHVGSGLKTVDDAAPNWFEISDGTEDRNVLVYQRAQAKIVGKDTVEVWADGVAAPKHVRFGWHPLARFNLANEEGLPAVSFRTDTNPRWRVAGK